LIKQRHIGVQKIGNETFIDSKLLPVAQLMMGSPILLVFIDEFGRNLGYRSSGVLSPLEDTRDAP